MEGFLHETVVVEATPGNKMILELFNSKYIQKISTENIWTKE